MSAEQSDKVRAAKGAFKSFVSSAGAAAKLIAAKAEQTKLTTLTLPAAYRELGKDCVQNKRHLAGNESLTTQLQSVLTESKALKEAAANLPVGKSLTDKAKAAGKQAADVARQKSLSMKRDSLLCDLGKAIFEQQRDQSGPERVVKPIQEALSRLAALEEQVTSLSAVGSGSWITPKRLIVAVVVLVALGAIGRWRLGASSSGAKTTSTQIAGEASGSESESSDPSSGSEQSSKPLEQLTKHYPANTGVELNESWDLEKTFEMPKKGKGWSNLFLLPNKTFAYCGTNFPIRVFDLTTNSELTGVDSPSPLNSPRISESCLLWMTGSKAEGAILIAWNYQDRKTQARLQVEPGFHTEGTFSFDQRLIATASEENGSFEPPPIRIWDATTSKSLYETTGRSPAAFSPDGSLLAFSDLKKTGCDGCVLWDFKAGKNKAILKRPDNDSKHGKLRQLAFVPKTSLLAVVWTDPGYLIELWNYQTGSLDAVLESQSAGRRQDINLLAASHDGTFLVTSGGRNVRVWNLLSGGRSATLLGDSKENVSSISISHDDNKIAAALYGQKVHLWTKRTDAKGEFAFGKVPQQHSGDPTDSKIKGPNGEKVMVGGNGLNSDYYFHYYLGKDGKKVLHGTSKGGVNGDKFTRESIYESGALITRSEFDRNRKLVQSYARQPDGNYVKLERRTMPDKSIVALLSVVSITKTDSGETIKEVQKAHVAADDDPLPPVSGRELKVKVGTVGIEKMEWWLKKHNASLSSVKCVATEDQLFIDFDVDASQWSPVQKAFPLLVRLFDKNGQYLKHFTTAEKFTAYVDVFDTFDAVRQRFLANGARDEADKFKTMLLKPKGNRLNYAVNVRDLRDASLVEIGFAE